MRCAWIPAIMVTLVSTVAWAQRAAPPEEPGWTVVEVPGGYYRYETQPDDRAGGGGVTVEPRARTAAPSPAAPSAPSEPPPAMPPPSAQGAPMPAHPGHARPAVAACAAERRSLAARLVYLRGIWFVDEATAELVLAAQEAPLLPQAYGYLPAYSPGANGNLLFTAVSSDLVARTLAEDYARCLDRG